MRATELTPRRSNRPSRSDRRDVPARREGGGDPLGALQSEINRVFDSFWRGFDLPMLGGGGAADLGNENLPRVDVRDTGQAIEVVAELPGMEPGDIEVSFSDGALTIRGEKRSEREDQDRDYVIRECSYGAIERTVPLPDGIDFDAAQASFRNGVLTITIPKTADAQAAVRRIQVQRG
jgi:HSP20 family protein